MARTIKCTKNPTSDEIEVTMLTGLGLACGTILMPKLMEEGLKKSYFESGAVKSSYLFINGEEVTDGINYNPFNINKRVEEKELKEEIKINLKNVEEGKPLTIPLAILNGKFKTEYKKRFGEFEKLDKEEVKARMKAYYQKPEVKAYMKAYMKTYYQKPEVKAYMKAHMKAYYQKPEVKAHKKAYQKAYFQKPEVKAHKKAYQKAYHQKHKKLKEKNEN